MKNYLKIILALFVLNVFTSTIYCQTFEEVAALFDMDTIVHALPAGGNGLSFADFNQDGLDDISMCTGNGQTPLFYQNMGNRFELVSPSFVSTTFNHKFISWVDYDNDGDKDLFVTAYGAPNYLYQNDGNMNFTINNAALGLPINNNTTFGATFSDVNKDGHLDLFVSNRLEPNNFFLYVDSVNGYINNTVAAGFDTSIEPSFLTTFFDYDNDNDLDVYLVNDKYDFANRLYENNGDGTFNDVSVASGANVSIDAMNGGVGDYNMDGYFDIYVTNTGESALLTNNGDGTFTDNALATGTIFDRIGWAGNFVDFDNDTDEDLYVCALFLTAGKPNAMFINQGDGTFTEPLKATNGIGGKDTIGSYVNAIGDFNYDGLNDIVCSPMGNDPRMKLWLNKNYDSGNFLKLKLEGVNSNREGFGAKIELFFGGGKRMFQKHSATGYLNQNSDYINIGLDTFSSFDSLVIHWPYVGSKDVILGAGIPLNKLLSLTEGSSVISNISDLNVCVDNHDILYQEIPPGDYYGSTYVRATGALIPNYSYLFNARNLIALDSNFHVPAGAIFEAKISVCP